MQDKFLTRWHKMLNLQRYPLPFHRARLAEELAEVDAATGVINRLSETSDVLFTISRSSFEGHPVAAVPPLTARNAPAYTYMLVKFTSRWGFYLAAAYLADRQRYSAVREVVNPRKDEKLVAVAERHGLEPVGFSRVAVGLRRVWPLLP